MQGTWRHIVRRYRRRRQDPGRGRTHRRAKWGSSVPPYIVVVAIIRVGDIAGGLVHLNGDAVEPFLRHAQTPEVIAFDHGAGIDLEAHAIDDRLHAHLRRLVVDSANDNVQAGAVLLVVHVDAG